MRRAGGRVAGFRSDPLLYRDGRAVANRVLDHPGDEPAPVLAGQAVAVQEEPELPGAGLRVGQALPFGDVVVVQLGVPPGRARDLVETVGRPGRGPVDVGDRHPAACDGVPGTRVTVTDDRVGGVAVERPSLPHGTV